LAKETFGKYDMADICLSNLAIATSLFASFLNRFLYLYIQFAYYPYHSLIISKEKKVEQKRKESKRKIISFIYV
jgi:hypothetical protein